NMTHDLQFTVEILTKRKEALDEVMRSFKRNHGSITNLRIIAANDEEEQNYYLAFLSVRASANANKQKMLEEAMAVDGVVEFTELEELDES
ncbi:MAG: hypothetical protein IJ091_06260, partial [Oscillospiraceae bacterium]|nr:hypothetical protein [Oscillospiraceae bacterium]